jgi:hypothetical protein
MRGTSAPVGSIPTMTKGQEKFNMELLDQLAKLNADLLELAEQRERALRAIIPEEIRYELDEVAEAWDLRMGALDVERKSLELAVRADVLGKKDTVKGATLFAFYTAGKVTWKTDGLDGYAVAHPEILAFRSVGEPFVTIRER